MYLKSTSWAFLNGPSVILTSCNLKDCIWAVAEKNVKNNITASMLLFFIGKLLLVLWICIFRFILLKKPFVKETRFIVFSIIYLTTNVYDSPFLVGKSYR